VLSTLSALAGTVMIRRSIARTGLLQRREINFT